jgi:hypothetical protein
MSTAEREAQRWYERFQETGVPEHNDDAAIGSLTQKLEAAAGVAGPRKPRGEHLGNARCR